MSKIDWVTITPISGVSGETVINIVPDENTTYSARSMTLKVSTGVNGEKENVTVYQKCSNYIMFKPNNLQFNGKSGYYTDALLECNGNWSLSGTPSWLSITPQTGIGNSTLVIHRTENTGSVRTATISGFSSDLSAVLNITQDVRPDSLVFVPDSVSFNGTGETKNVNVECNYNWSLRGIPSWLSVAPTSGQSGITTITLTASTNGGIERNVNITGSTDVINKVLSVYQDGNENGMIKVLNVDNKNLLQNNVKILDSSVVSAYTEPYLYLKSPSIITVTPAINFSGDTFSNGRADYIFPETTEAYKIHLFNNMHNIRSINITNNSHNDYPGNYNYIAIIRNCDIENLTIGNNVCFSTIQDSAGFREGIFDNSTINNLTIGSNVKMSSRSDWYWGTVKGVFNICNFSAVTIDSGATLGRYSFMSCTGETLNIGDNAVVSAITDYESVEASSIHNCTFNNVVFGNNTTISSHTITSNIINNLTIGNGSIIYPVAFYKNSNASSINNLTIGSGSTMMNTAFANINLKTVVVGSNTSFGDNVFSNCPTLYSVTLPEDLVSIPNYTFKSCTSLSSITIPNSVISIGQGAFYECRSLAEITIPSGVTDIGNYAFYSCRSLTEITIPSAVTNIGDYAFSCRSLATINYNSTKAQWNNISKGNGWNESVPATVVHCTDGDVPIS